jgi:hypothetical protein
MGVSIKGDLRWMIYNGKSYSNHDLGVPLFQETFILWLNQAFVTRPCARWAPHLVIGARSSSLMVEREEDITIS